VRVAPPPSHCSRNFAIAPSASRASNHASKSAASSGWSARDEPRLAVARERPDPRERLDRALLPERRLGAVGHDRVDLLVDQQLDHLVVVGHATSVAFGRLALRDLLEVSAAVHGDPDLRAGRALPSRSPALGVARERDRLGLRHGHGEPPAADRSGAPVTPEAATSKRPAASAEHELRPAEAHEHDLAAALRRPRAQQRHVEPSGSARSFFAWLNGA
jgi:hypothetical protein